MKNTIGEFLSERREHLGLSRIQVAKMANISEHTLAAFEQGTRIPNPTMVTALADALQFPAQTRDHLVRLANPALLRGPINPRKLDGDPDEVDYYDRLELDITPYPYAFTRFPLFDVIACNTAYEQVLPGLTAGDNAIEWMLLDPRAMTTMVEWRALVHGMVNALRHLSATASNDRVDQIIANCEGHPEWKHFWSTHAPALTHANVVPLRDSVGNISRYAVRLDRPEHPHRNWMRYRLIPVPTRDYNNLPGLPIR